MHARGPCALPPADVASEQCAATPDMGSGSGSRAPKNGGALRVGPAGLPLKIPSAMRKRGFDETMAAVSWQGAGVPCVHWWDGWVHWYEMVGG